MAKINILSSQVYNRIAAGEVVDRPYSVVKELVENAIDAGATEIEIYVENGGKQLIRVVDNGVGIERDDLHSAFLPHATSKISKAEDLDTIMTLGFRGEAVASIAAVSKMTITSKVQDGKCYSLSCNGGEMGVISETSGANGTDVSVEMLFFNAPVRLKFLKSDKAEETDITTFVSRFILNRPNICFTYYVNGKKILQSFGGGLEEALVCVYGASARSQCIEINAEKHGMRIRGYIGNQNFTKPNKSYQCVFLNGRYVLNGTIASAVQGAYAAYLMKRQYPFYVLHIELPPEVVDVNVSPNKTDVRFVDNNVIYGCVYSVISSVLDGKAGALEYIVQSTTETIEPPTQEQTILPVKTQEKDEVAPKTSLSQSILSQTEPSAEEPKKRSSTVFGFETLTYEEAQKEIEAVAPKFKKQAPIEASKGYIPMDKIPDYEPDKIATVSEWDLPKRNPKRGNPERLLKLFPGAKYSPGIILEFDDPNYSGPEPAATSTTDYFEANKQYLAELDKKQSQDKIDVSSCTYVGKMFNTYIMYEKGDDVYIIDQHAAHERLIYDRLKMRMQNRQIVSQPMLVPYELQVNVFEAEFLRERMQDICDIGFAITEKSDGLFFVEAIPVDIPKMDIKSFFDAVLSDISGFRAIKLVDILKDKLATMACKAAIKGGMDITQEEVAELFQQMDGNMGLKCPHGRPVVVKLSKTEVEKMFKRIV